MKNVIEVTDLAKRYGERTVLDGVSFTVQRGEIFGILGPNGAGKTTLVESIAGLRAPDSGTISVLGLDPRRDSGRLRNAPTQDPAALPNRTETATHPPCVRAKRLSELVSETHASDDRVSV